MFLHSADIQKIEGFVKITDKSTGEIILEKKNAIHYGNLSYVIALALAGQTQGHIKFMGFGNGAASISSSGAVLYKTPNTSTIKNLSADLYNRTYSKDVSVRDGSNSIDLVTTNPNFTDIIITATLDSGEPAGQETLDTTIDNEGDYVFDEIAIFSAGQSTADLGTMITHVIFHPVQKSENRVIEVNYTLRVQMG